jgi:hypothetical protein
VKNDEGYDTNGEDTDIDGSQFGFVQDDGYEADVEDIDKNGEDTDTDDSQWSIPRCTRIERDDGFDADVEDRASVFNLESVDGYDADDEDDGDNADSI